MEIEIPPLSEEDLDRIVSYLPYFEGGSERYGDWPRVNREEERVFITSPVRYRRKASEFADLLVESGFTVRQFDWPAWDEGREIVNDPERIARADLLTLRKLRRALSATTDSAKEYCSGRWPTERWGES